MSKLRENWQKIRDAAGLKQGYTKASMGELLDQWVAVVAPLMKKSPVTKWDDADLKKAKDSSIKLFVASLEYREKVAKEKGLKAFKVTAGDGATFDVPYAHYGRMASAVPSEQKTKDPVRLLMAFLNEKIGFTYQVIRRGQAHVELLKLHPETKGHWDQLFAEDSDSDKRKKLDRKTWQTHRDGAGLKPGYAKVSVGEKLDAFWAAFGGETPTTYFPGSMNDAQRAKVAQAAAELYEAAMSYLAKLLTQHKKIDTPALKAIVEDLELMGDMTKRLTLPAPVE